MTSFENKVFSVPYMGKKYSDGYDLIDWEDDKEKKSARKPKKRATRKPKKDK